MILASVLLSYCALAPQEIGSYSKPTIRFEYNSGEEWWTVRVRNYSSNKLVERVSELTGRSIEGQEFLEDAPLITVDLDRRPLNQVLEYALGSVGLRFELRRDAITVTPANGDLEFEEMMAMASAAWIKATTRFPDHEQAPGARLAQGEIAEMRGFGQVARKYYLDLTEDYPDSQEVDDAYMRAGRLSSRMGHYNEAGKYYRKLAEMDNSEYRATARLELARVLIELGDWQYSLYILNDLDEYFPPIDPVERTGRALVRASAHNARGNPLEALRELDGMDEHFDSLGAWEALSIRAIALEGLSMHGEAARAWLAYSRDAIGEAQEQALEQAARLSLESGDELGTLFVCRHASRLGIADGFPSYQRKARRALGFAVAGDAKGAGTIDRIAHGEALLEEGQLGLASVVFEDLFAGRRALNEIEAARVTGGWATSIADQEGFETAVSILSAERGRYQELDAKKHLDVVAARILEAADQLERAVEAYQGSY